MSKSNTEIAAEILTAAIEAKIWTPDGAIPKVKAESIGDAYAIILRSVRKAAEGD